MTEKDRLIGRVIAVQSENVLVELEKDSKTLTKTFVTGTYPIARINSYVVIPVSAVLIVGIVTRVSMAKDDVEITPQATLALPQPKRTISVTMVGTLDKMNGKLNYKFGIKQFPALDNPVWFILEEELDVIFDKDTNADYFIPIGKSTAYSEYDVKLNPNKLFSRHLGVLGNTGAGKSHTIANLLQTIIRKEEISKNQNAHLLIFDTNGEYSKAFDKLDAEIIEQEDIKIPYWFMSFQDLRTLFKVTGGVQEPVLSRGIAFAKQQPLLTQNPEIIIRSQNDLINAICYNCHLIIDGLYPTNTRQEGFVVKNTKENCEGIISLLEKFYSELKKLETEAELSESIISIFKEIVKKCPTGDYKKFEPTLKEEIKHEIEEIITKIEPFINELKEDDNSTIFIDVDSPTYFDLQYLYEQALPLAMKIEGKQNEKIKEYCSTMMLRIKRLITDDRFKAILQRSNGFPDSLALFLRLCLGRMGNAKIDFDSIKVNPKEYENTFIENYINKLSKQSIKSNKSLIIFDLSLIPSEILQNVTALLGRIILEFLQRIDKTSIYKKKNLRSKFPIVLVLEEAHNYIPELIQTESGQVSKEVFERIAREGRKYGLSLIVSSQRPSELSKTVLSQCNSFIVHRIQNPEDQAYIKKLLPSISQDLLNQLPVLAQGVALVFGDCVRAPMQVDITMPDPTPKSDDPKYWEHWTGKVEFPDDNNEPNFEAVCAEWEGKRKEIAAKKSIKQRTKQS